MGKKELVCIIDDDPIYVFALKRVINMYDLCDNILVFGNGEEALRYFKPLLETSEAFPDLILLDINMPIMDGWQFLDHFVVLKPKIDHEVNIYMVSSSVNEYDINKAKTYEDVSDYIMKPIKIDELKRIMGAA